MALQGVRVLELAGLAPVPFCGMVLADFGADVVKVDRDLSEDAMPEPLCRGKRSVSLNLKSALGREALLQLVDRADVLIEPFRPGVMEKLGLGPDVLLARNSRLIFARLTGFGQSGSMKARAGHDINYLALSGALSLFGRNDRVPPLPPVNLLADFAGGGLMCALGILIALFERSKSGKGQVVDTAMVDGVSYLSSFVHRLAAAGHWQRPRGQNLLDTGAPFYDTYRCKDDRFVAVGAIEPQFYAELIQGLGLDPDQLPHQMDSSRWPEMKIKFAEVFASKTREEWDAVFGQTDACVTPVLELNEVMNHPHNKERQLLVQNQDQDGTLEPTVAPRLSRTPGHITGPRPRKGQHTAEVFRQWGVPAEAMQKLFPSQDRPTHSKL
eukprot:GILK01008471.1.p1 GENE.GILK01008471.1~~GILK01008471.1.p1  ORF type:complete len:396 (-),score=49.01 GILK01008471.1:79-1227(-)